MKHPTEKSCMIVDNYVEDRWKTCAKLLSFVHNMRKCTLIFLLLCLIFPLHAQEKLSGTAQISLLTCDPGPDLYAIFGHTCIRVNDPVNGLDEVYNYGTFDFDTPNFYLKFIRGKLNYMLSKTTYEQFRYEYVYMNRSVREQTLNLTPLQKQRFYDYLYSNFLPENRFYLYDYFFNNCATQPRDVFWDVLGDSLNTDSLHIPKEMSFRDLIDPYLQTKPWTDFGIDLILGMPVDQRATLYERMFLPDYLMLEVEKAQIERKGDLVPLVRSNYMIINGAILPGKYKGWFTPLNVAWSLFVIFLLISAWGFIQQKTQRWVDFLLFLTIGLTGIVMLLMWFGTDHTAASQNLNILWALPVHFFVAPFILSQTLPKLRPYFLGNAVLQGLIIAGGSLIPQNFHVSILPVILILILRSLYRWQHQS